MESSACHFATDRDFPQLHRGVRFELAQPPAYRNSYVKIIAEALICLHLDD